MKDLFKFVVQPVGIVFNSLEFAKKEEKDRIELLSKALQSLSKCLEKIIQSLQDSNNIPQELRSELKGDIKKIAQPFEKTSIGDEVKEIAKDLSELEKKTYDPNELEEWKDVLGKVNVLSKPLYISLQEKN